MLRTNGQSTDLGTLPGGTSSTALAINQHGSIVDSAITATGQSQAFLCASGRLVDLNDAARPSSGREGVVATAVNKTGRSVGTGTLQGKSHAVLLTPNGGRGAASTSGDFTSQRHGPPPQRTALGANCMGSS
jgi:probable HAF family extracellular repeat protein